MDDVNYSPEMTQFVVANSLLEEDFTLIDVGCSGGISDIWRVFGERLHAFGIDPQRLECARLNQAEKNPRVRYFPYLVGVEADHWFHQQKRQQDATRDRYFGVYMPRLSASLALECSASVQPQDNPTFEHLTDERISVSRFVREQAIRNADFIKIDTDGCDLEALLSCEDVIRSGTVLGFLIETPFIGSDDPTSNSFHNIDRCMRQHGYCLYSLSMNRYSRRALPSLFKLPIAAQTVTGQSHCADVLYLRDAASPEFEAVCGPHSFAKVLKLACLYEIFNLSDCAVELIQYYRKDFAAHTGPDRLLDLLTPPLYGVRYSYADYLRLFREDVSQFFPGSSLALEEERRRRRRTLGSMFKGLARRAKRALAG
jgi:FkbM family methyltransferase